MYWYVSNPNKKNQENGHIENNFFEKLGFPMGEDTDESFDSRDSIINQETRQREKCLSYHHQVSLREGRIASIENEVRSKAADNQHKFQNLIDDNIECDERILNIISEKGIEELDIRNATFEYHLLF